MNNAHQLAPRFREVILDGTFIANTNFKAQLSGTGWQMVTTQVSSLNTIATLAQHIHYYIKGVSQVLQGGMLEIKDKYSFDFPPVTSQEQWDAFMTRFWDDAATFAGLVAQLPEDKLNSSFTDEKYGSYLRNIDAMIEHCYYHLGQVTLLKKLLMAAQA